MFDGVFKNNYYYQGGSIAFNPIQPMSQILDYINNFKKIQLTKEFRKREEKKIVDLVNHKESILNKIELSYEAGMTPFVLSTMNAYLSLKDVSSIIEQNNRQVYIFDVKRALLDLTNGPAKLANPISRSPDASQYMQATKHALARILSQGGVFIISLDDSSTPTSSEGQLMSVPSLAPLYHPKFFPSQILFPDDLKNPSVFRKVLEDTEYQSADEINKEAIVMVWGKLKMKPDDSLSVMLEKIMRHYEKKPGHSDGVPMNPMNIYVIEN